MSELYGYQSTNSRELDHIPKQCQFAIFQSYMVVSLVTWESWITFLKVSVCYISELYGCQSSNSGELDHIPKQCQFAIFQGFMVVSLVTRESWITFLNSVSLVYFRVIWLSVQ